ncbi:MAG TPA: hypothetical protein PKJ84_04780 [Anaerolineales bacterium]|nr:hypothetical protein [Anaerolineales bacterium]HNH25769.1 hypothetical protein [Anaerolineales bacterium]HNM35840.1 hypothetical protein [Anaerolineales bacterium]HNO93460.1 hypothetical protein [Anaerolineales bacterium]
MKYLSVALIALIMAGCGPSSPEMTATADMAMAETQTAAPTSTPTLTPTSTATPTSTTTPILTLTPTLPHEAPGIDPGGMPESANSLFFESTPMFTFNLGGSVKVNYIVFLEIKKELPKDAILEVHFQNPADPSTAYVVVVTDLTGEKIMVESKKFPMSNFECRNYWIDVHIYADRESIYELGTHVQWTSSSFC